MKLIWNGTILSMLVIPALIFANGLSKGQLKKVSDSEYLILAPEKLPAGFKLTEFSLDEVGFRLTYKSGKKLILIEGTNSDMAAGVGTCGENMDGGPETTYPGVDYSTDLIPDASFIVDKKKNKYCIYGFELNGDQIPDTVTEKTKLSYGVFGSGVSQKEYEAFLSSIKPLEK